MMIPKHSAHDTKLAAIKIQQLLKVVLYNKTLSYKYKLKELG